MRNYSSRSDGSFGEWFAGGESRNWWYLQILTAREEFAESMYVLYTTPKKADEMGANGKSRVKDNFNLARFASELNTLVK